MKNEKFGFLNISIFVTSIFIFSIYAQYAQAENSVASAPDQSSESYGDWTVRCVNRDGLPPCDIVQFVTNDKTKEQLMRLSIAYSGQAERYGFQIQMPLGVIISGGVIVRLDDKENWGNLKFTRCEVSGCYIETVITADTLDPFRRANKGVVAILDREAKPMVLPISFNGFSAAMDVMSQKNITWVRKKVK